MKPLSIALLSVLVSAGAASATVVVLRPSAVTADASDSAARPSGDAGAPAAEVRELRAELAAQRELLEDLARRLELRTPPERAAVPAHATADEVEDVVRSVLADEQGGPARAVASDGDPSPGIDAKSALARILDLHASGSGYAALESYWKKVREAGVMDEVVALFEEHAELHPNDPEAQVMLGNAYIQRLQSATGAEAGQWAIRADGAYSAALELDERNWEARFSKAVSLSFWPPIFGKQQEAISQFETLLEQQRTSPPAPGHAQTYVYLGNLYQQQGNVEKARAIWADGLAAFPEDEDLQEKVGG